MTGCPAMPPLPLPRASPTSAAPTCRSASPRPPLTRCPPPPPPPTPRSLPRSNATFYCSNTYQTDYSCYSLHTEEVDFPTAHANCMALGGYLPIYIYIEQQRAVER
jgi:hypothetical protein